MYSRDPFVRRPGFGGLGGGFGPPPRDVLILLVVIFVTFTLRQFATTADLVNVLRLSPAIWQQGQLWRVMTYPVAGTGVPGLWFLLELLILYWFARDVYNALGRLRFWKLLAFSSGGAGVVAVATQLLVVALGGAVPSNGFLIVQGQHILVVVAIASFATLYRNATIYFLFLIPLPARWFLWIEVLLGFMAFLNLHDVAGFLGLCTAVGISYIYLAPTSARRMLREGWLRFQRWRIQLKLARIRKKTGIHVVRDEDPPRRDPWVN